MTGAPCTAPGCAREVYARGLCLAHYHRDRRRAAGVPPAAPPLGADAQITVRVPGRVRAVLEARAEEAGGTVAGEARAALERDCRRP